MLVGKYAETTIKFAISSKIKDLLLRYLKAVLLQVHKKTWSKNVHGSLMYSSRKVLTNSQHWEYVHMREFWTIVKKNKLRVLHVHMHLTNNEQEKQVRNQCVCFCVILCNSYMKYKMQNNTIYYGCLCRKNIQVCWWEPRNEA